MHSAPEQSPLEIVVFEVAGQLFGVTAAQVVTIVRAPTLAAAPQSHAAIKGIMNLRGQVVPVFDLRHLLQLPDTPLAHTDHLIVIRTNNHWLALRADRAVELVDVPADRVESAEGIVPHWSAVSAVARFPDRLVLLLEPQQLFASEAQCAGDRSLLTPP